MSLDMGMDAKKGIVWLTQAEMADLFDVGLYPNASFLISIRTAGVFSMVVAL